jgi:hypothetical protein
MMTASREFANPQRDRLGEIRILETEKDTVSLATGKPPSRPVEPVFAKTSMGGSEIL